MIEEMNPLFERVVQQNRLLAVSQILKTRRVGLRVCDIFLGNNSA